MGTGEVTGPMPELLLDSGLRGAGHTQTKYTRAACSTASSPIMVWAG